MRCTVLDLEPGDWITRVDMMEPLSFRSVLLGKTIIANVPYGGREQKLTFHDGSQAVSPLDIVVWIEKPQLPENAG